MPQRTWCTKRHNLAALKLCKPLLRASQCDCTSHPCIPFLDLLHLHPNAFEVWHDRGCCADLGSSSDVCHHVICALLCPLVVRHSLIVFAAAMPGCGSLVPVNTAAAPACSCFGASLLCFLLALSTATTAHMAYAPHDRVGGPHLQPTLAV